MWEVWFSDKDIIKRKEELKGELKTINDKIDRKFQLVVETKGGDFKLIQDFLKAYVAGMTRFNELSELIRNQSLIAGTAAISKKYLKGIQERFEGVKKYIKDEFQENAGLPKSSETVKKFGLQSLAAKREAPVSYITKHSSFFLLFEDGVQSIFYFCKLSFFPGKRVVFALNLVITLSG